MNSYGGEGSHADGSAGRPGGDTPDASRTAGAAASAAAGQHNVRRRVAGGGAGDSYALLPLDSKASLGPQSSGSYSNSGDRRGSGSGNADTGDGAAPATTADYAPVSAVPFTSGITGLKPKTKRKSRFGAVEIVATPVATSTTTTDTTNTAAAVPSPPQAPSPPPSPSPSAVEIEAQQQQQQQRMREYQEREVREEAERQQQQAKVAAAAAAALLHQQQQQETEAGQKTRHRLVAGEETARAGGLVEAEAAEWAAIATAADRSRAEAVRRASNRVAAAAEAAAALRHHQEQQQHQQQLVAELTAAEMTLRSAIAAQEHEVRSEAVTARAAATAAAKEAEEEKEKRIAEAEEKERRAAAAREERQNLAADWLAALVATEAVTRQRFAAEEAAARQQQQRQQLSDLKDRVRARLSFATDGGRGGGDVRAIHSEQQQDQNETNEIEVDPLRLARRYACVIQKAVMKEGHYLHGNPIDPSTMTFRPPCSPLCGGGGARHPGCTAPPQWPPEGEEEESLAFCKRSIDVEMGVRVRQVARRAAEDGPEAMRFVNMQLAMQQSAVGWLINRFLQRSQRIKHTNSNSFDNTFSNSRTAHAAAAGSPNSGGANSEPLYFLEGSEDDSIPNSDAGVPKLLVALQIDIHDYWNQALEAKLGSGASILASTLALFSPAAAGGGGEGVDNDDDDDDFSSGSNNNRGGGEGGRPHSDISSCLNANQEAEDVMRAGGALTSDWLDLAEETYRALFVNFPGIKANEADLARVLAERRKNVRNPVEYAEACVQQLSRAMGGFEAGAVARARRRMLQATSSISAVYSRQDSGACYDECQAGEGCTATTVTNANSSCNDLLLRKGSTATPNAAAAAGDSGNHGRMLTELRLSQEESLAWLASKMTAVSWWRWCAEGVVAYLLAASILAHLGGTEKRGR